MNKLTIIIFLAIGLFACEQDKILPSDVDVIIANQVKSNEEIIKQMTAFIDKHGKDGFESSFEIVERFVKIHDDVKDFITSLEKMDKHRLARESNEFVKSAFSALPIEHPLTITLNEDTPASLIKLQIVNLENLYLRERGGQVSYSFNNFELVVIPDKIEFQKGENITGRMGLMGYADQMKRPMKMNGSEIEVREGLGFFSVAPSDLIEGQKSLKAEIIFRDTTFTSFLKLR